MLEYTQAVAVDKSFTYILLIKRNNQPCKGKLSGVGGHVEKGESPKECMKREWFEEVGFEIPTDALLTKIMTQILPDCTNHIFGIVLPKIEIYFNNPTDEGYIRWYHILGDHIMDLNNNKVAWNGMIPYCLNLLKKQEQEKQLIMLGKSFDDDRWITIHPNNGEGRKVKIDENGKIVGGDIPKETHGENITTLAQKNDKLTSKEKYAIEHYTDLNDSSTGFLKLNEALRNDKKLDKNQDEQIKNLDNALSKLPNYEGETYRKIFFKNKKDQENFLNQHTENKTVEYKEYISTTNNVKSIGLIAPDMVALKIIGKNGKDISKQSLSSNENEILFPRNSKFVVKKVAKSKYGGHMMILQEV